MEFSLQPHYAQQQALKLNDCSTSKLRHVDASLLILCFAPFVERGAHATKAFLECDATGVLHKFPEHFVQHCT